MIKYVNNKKEKLQYIFIIHCNLRYELTHANSTKLSTLSDNAWRLATKRSQKSRKSGRSIFFKPSLVLASTLTYNCVTGTKSLYKHAFKKITQSRQSLLANAVFGFRLVGQVFWSLALAKHGFYYRPAPFALSKQ